MDPVEKAKAEMGGLENAISGLPGIKGYREKEMRRDADKQLRDTLASRLSGRRSKLTSLQNDLLSSGGLLWMDDMERVVGRLQLFIDRVKTAAYGYAPLFALNRVKEDDLDRLTQFDQALFDQIGALDEAISGLQKAVQANEGIREALTAVGDVVNGFNETFNRRSEVIQNAAD
jgi:hypothetical protein